MPGKCRQVCSLPPGKCDVIQVRCDARGKERVEGGGAGEAIN